MKTASYILFCLLLIGIRVDLASGAIITVNVTAHVIQLSDPNGVLAGQIVMGQAITGTYTYDTSTPDQGSPGFGSYLPIVPPASLSVSAGSLLFQTYAPQPPNLLSPIVQISVRPTSTNSLSSFFLVSSSNQLLNSGVPVGLIDSMSFNFTDLTGQWPASDALPSGAPALQNLSASPSAIIIYSTSSTHVQMTAQIDSVALAPPSFAVSPASGSFLPTQRFDAAVLLPAGAQVVSMQTSVNGNPFSLNYPGMCTLVILRFTNQQAILCPNAYAVLTTPPPPPALPSQPGQPLTITWQVTLADGTSINKTVVWTLIPP
jgi:hypothetical protein